jgi:hypothetical protein
MTHPATAIATKAAATPSLRTRLKREARRSASVTLRFTIADVLSSCDDDRRTTAALTTRWAVSMSTLPSSDATSGPSISTRNAGPAVPPSSITSPVFKRFEPTREPLTNVPAGVPRSTM